LLAPEELNTNIIDYAREEFNLLLGERTAEDVKIAIGSAYPLSKPLVTSVRGRDLITGLPKEIQVTDEQIREALARSVQTIVNNVKTAVEETPPEIVADIMKRGIVLAGGGALLRGLDQLLHEQTQMPIAIAEDPLTAVARGTGMVLEDLDSLKDVLVTPQFEKSPR
jgi:rod shape-determining protein MreB